VQKLSKEFPGLLKTWKQVQRFRAVRPPPPNLL